jgi:hypothetical protein
MDSPSPPPAPDPHETAQAQYQYNADAARLNTQLNRPTQITPYGTMKWTQAPSTRTFNQSAYEAAVKESQTAAARSMLGNGGSSTGNGAGYYDNAGEFHAASQASPAQMAASVDRNDPRFWSDTPSDQWTSEIILDPKVKALVDAQLDTSMGLQGSIKNALTRVDQTMAQPLDFSADALQQGRKSVEDALYQSYTRRLDPQYAERENTLRSDLMNRGFMEGTEAFQREMDRFSRDRVDAYGAATRDSVLAGGSEQDRQIANMLRGRNQVINELSSLRTGAQAPMPQFASGQSGASVQPGNYQAAANTAYQGQLAGYNADVASGNAMMGGLFSLGGAMLGGPAGSVGGTLLSRFLGG